MKFELNESANKVTFSYNFYMLYLCIVKGKQNRMKTFSVGY